MWRERSARRVLDMQRRADIAVFSVDAVARAVPTHVYLAGYLDDEDMKILHEDGVVGEVCTVFLRADGTYKDMHLNERATGPEPRGAAAHPAAHVRGRGDNKVAPLLAALRAGVVTHLVATRSRRRT